MTKQTKEAYSMTRVNETKMNFNKPVKGNFLEEQVHYPVFSTAAETELA